MLLTNHTTTSSLGYNLFFYPPHPGGLWSLIWAKWIRAKKSPHRFQNNEGKEVRCCEALSKFGKLPFVILKMGVMLGACHSGLW